MARGCAPFGNVAWHMYDEATFRSGPSPPATNWKARNLKGFRAFDVLGCLGRLPGRSTDCRWPSLGLQTSQVVVPVDVYRLAANSWLNLSAASAPMPGITCW